MTAASFALAEDAFQAAARIGESDPRPYQQLCGLWVGALRNQFWESGGDLVPLATPPSQPATRRSSRIPIRPRLTSKRAAPTAYWAGYEMYQGREDTEALDEARRHARAAIEAAPENPTPYVLLGVTHRIAANLLAARGEEPRDEFAGAVAAYREAIRLRPSDSGRHMSLASALLYLGDHARTHGEISDDYFEAAAEAAAQAVELEPDVVGGHVNLGIADPQLGISARDRGLDPTAHFDRADAAFERAIELNPSFYTAHYNLGETLLEAAVGEFRGGLDPTPKLLKSLEMLEASAGGYPDWAAPRYLQAEALALLAEHALLTGGDSGGILARAKDAIAAGRAINPTDATGLSRSLSHTLSTPAGEPSAATIPRRRWPTASRPWLKRSRPTPTSPRPTCAAPSSCWCGPRGRSSRGDRRRKISMTPWRRWPGPPRSTPTTPRSPPPRPRCAGSIRAPDRRTPS